MANTKRPGRECFPAAPQHPDDMYSAAEKMMEETAAKHRSEPEGKVREEIKMANEKPKEYGSSATPWWGGARCGKDLAPTRS
jgi:hypothetical protein